MSWEYDPYWENTILLINLQGADGGTAGIIDRSPRFASVTRAGNAQLDTATAPSGIDVSLLLDGTGDYIETPNNSAFSPGAINSHDFTIEGFFKINVGSRANTIYNKRDTSGAEELSIGVGTANVLSCSAWRAGAAVEFSIVGTTNVVDSNWHHFAVTRSGASWRLFLDGTQEGSTTTQVNAIATNSQGPRYGRDGFNTGRDFNGWLGPLRVTDNVARYTANFTPPTLPFPDDAKPIASIKRLRRIKRQDSHWANVYSLLGFESASGVSQNPVVDDSEWARTNAVAVWGGPIGTPTVNRENNRSYMTLTGNNSGYNSNGEHSIWGMGAGYHDATTIELLIWLTALPAAATEYTILSQRDETSTSIRKFLWYVNSAGAQGFVGYGSGGVAAISLTSTDALVTGAWNHVAMVRDHGDWMMFTNGKLQASGTESVALYHATEIAVRLARDIHGIDSYFSGRMDEFRLTQGVARYTQSFSMESTGIAGDFGVAGGIIRGHFPRQ